MKYFQCSFFLLFIFVFAITPTITLAQEDATSTSDAEEVFEIAELEIEPIRAPLLVSNISIERESVGEYRVSWMTSGDAAGAVTYMTASQGGAIQNRLTNGRFSRQHQYIISGLPVGTNSLLIESVGSDLAYARKAVDVIVPEGQARANPASPNGLMVVFFFLTPLVLLFVAEELLRLRKEVKINFEELSDKVKQKIKRTPARRKKAPVKIKTITKKAKTKNIEKK